MTKSTRATTKIRKKRPDAPGTPVQVRLQPDLLSLLDKHATKMEVSRPEAIRNIVQDWLKRAGYFKD